MLFTFNNRWYKLLLTVVYCHRYLSYIYKINFDIRQTLFKIKTEVPHISIFQFSVSKKRVIYLQNV